jgi:flagellar hook assembly protein FlgD
VAKDNIPISIEIFNIRGQKVRTLMNDSVQKGSHNQVWDGKDDNMHNVSSGTYIITMKAAGYTKTTKAILIK